MQRLALAQALEDAQRYADQPQGWLYFCGPCGAGKSHQDYDNAAKLRFLPTRLCSAKALLCYTKGPEHALSMRQAMPTVRKIPNAELDTWELELAPFVLEAQLNRVAGNDRKGLTRIGRPGAAGGEHAWRARVYTGNGDRIIQSTALTRIVLVRNA